MTGKPVDELARPEVKKLCVRCYVTEWDVLENRVVVSPRGTAHHPRSGSGFTVCSLDATGERWWWPW